MMMPQAMTFFLFCFCLAVLTEVTEGRTLLHGDPEGMMILEAEVLNLFDELKGVRGDMEEMLDRVRKMEFEVGSVLGVDEEPFPAMNDPDEKKGEKDDVNEENEVSISCGDHMGSAWCKGKCHWCNGECQSSMCPKGEGDPNNPDW
mmetsp:Transcript_25771/g.29520  ORF Transcript_25771/g.29520 Transcript_25771/m.29520 type:complete len:146 (+) Transcript_25771:157-594(+)